MRFESYHQRLKKIVEANSNFKNISLSIASRLQFRKCYEFFSSDCMCDIAPICDARLMPWDSLPREYVELIRGQHNVDDCPAMRTVNVLHKECHEYAVHDIYVLDKVDSDVIFCMIEHIVLINAEWLLCTKLLKPIRFIEHFHSYSVKEVGRRIVRPNNLRSHKPHDMYVVGDINLIRLLCHV